MSRPPENSVTPYLVGAGIGALNAFAFLSAKRGLGVSTAFETLAAKASQSFAPDLTNVNAYLKEREGVPKTDWQSLLVLGVPLGSFLAARAGGRAEMSEIPAEWSKRFGNGRPKRYVGAFLGGAILMLGARLAKGCTSGHGLTGTSQLALSSLLFTPLMFATAIVAARVIYKEEPVHVTI